MKDERKRTLLEKLSALLVFRPKPANRYRASSGNNGHKKVKKAKVPNR